MGSPKITVDNYISQIVGKGISASNLFEFALQPTQVMVDFWADNGKAYPWYSNAGSQLDAGMYRMNLLCQEYILKSFDLTHHYRKIHIKKYHHRFPMSY